MRILMLSMVTLFLAGCGLFTKVEYVERPVYITKYRTIDDSYLHNCPIAQPPERLKYKQATCEQRNVMWIETYSKQIKDTVIRNETMEELREVNKYLKESYDEKIDETK